MSTPARARLTLAELGLGPGTCRIEVDPPRFDERLGAWVAAVAPVWTLSLRFADEALQTWLTGELRVQPDELRALLSPGAGCSLRSAPEGTHTLGRGRRPVPLLEPFVWELRGLGSGRLAVHGEAQAGPATVAVEGEARLEEASARSTGTHEAEAEALLRAALPEPLLAGWARQVLPGTGLDDPLLLTYRRSPDAPPEPLPSPPPRAAQGPPRRLELSPGAVPTPERPLVLADGPRTVAALTLGYRDGHLHLEVTVDERSGEDGALAPSLDLPLPAPPWRGLERTDQDGVEAWLGNDAPALTGNRVRIEGPDETGAVLLDWTARWTDVDSSGPCEAPLWLRARVPLSRLLAPS